MYFFFQNSDDDTDDDDTNDDIFGSEDEDFYGGRIAAARSRRDGVKGKAYDALGVIGQFVEKRVKEARFLQEEYDEEHQDVEVSNQISYRLYD